MSSFHRLDERVSSGHRGALRSEPHASYADQFVTHTHTQLLASPQSFVWPHEYDSSVVQNGQNLNKQSKVIFQEIIHHSSTLPDAVDVSSSAVFQQFEAVNMK